MEQDPVIAVLNELLSAELHSLPRRLLESTVFISNFSVREYGLVQQLAKAAEEHASWLADAILARGGVPGPRRVDTRTADLHFVDLHHTFPQLVAERETMIQRYTRALDRLALDREASGLVSRILNDHEQERGSLEREGAGLSAS